MHLVKGLDRIPGSTSWCLLLTKKGNMSEDVFDLIVHPTISYIHVHVLADAIDGVVCLWKVDKNHRCSFVISNLLTGQFLETTSLATLAPDGII